MKTGPIGPSNGHIYNIGVYNIKYQTKVFLDAKATAVETNLTSFTSKEGKKRIDSLLSAEGLNDCFEHFSIHAPDFNPNISVESQMKKLVKMNSALRPRAILVHPLKLGVNKDYSKKYFSELVLEDIPLAIENMDKRKDSGFKLKDLAGLTSACRLMFVLDVQHAYERDETMKYSEDLFNCFDSRNELAYFHVSGQTKDQKHALVHKAENAGAIIGFLGSIFDQTKKYPIILEGMYRTGREIAEEITFLKEELGI